jgi:poly(3-hydroxyalkanoate) synthetase
VIVGEPVIKGIRDFKNHSLRFHKKAISLYISGNNHSLFKEESMARENSISPTSLLTLMGVTPADNREGLTTALPWKSNMGGTQTKALFHYQRLLDSMSERSDLFGPFAIFASLQSTALKMFITDPIKAHARLSVRSGRDPDLIRDMNGWIYKNYTRLLYDLCDYFIHEDCFDREKAKRVSTTEEGHEMLKEYIQEFSQMEHNYNALGVTRLMAMKELLKCLLVVITEMPLDKEPLPYMRKHKDGSDAMTFEEYLTENRCRFECLHKVNAFDLKEYSERTTGGKIGYSPYEIVQGSQLRHVNLRHYFLPKGIKSNGKVLYVATPLINKPELFDLAEGKSVVDGMLKEGYDLYLVDFGTPGADDTHIGFDFYDKTVHDHYLEIIKKKHPKSEIYAMGYCMGGTLITAYLARRAEERLARGEKMDVTKIALMASPVKFDDGDSGHGPMRSFLRQHYDAYLMSELFGSVNVPPQMIEFGMNDIQPGVHYTVMTGFYSRAIHPNAIEDAAPFLYWLTHGTKFPARAHRDWVQLFLTDPICEGKFCLPSTIPELDGKPVNMDALREAGVRIFDYRGSRDPIAPPGSCIASQLWGLRESGNISMTRGGMNRTIEKNIGHIFVVSKVLLAEYLQAVNSFLCGEKCEGADKTI